MSGEINTHEVNYLKPLPWLGNTWRLLLAQHQSRQLAHAYLMVGEQGIGKYQLARSFANYLLCHNQTENLACGHCNPCLLNASGTHPDLLLVEPEPGSKAIKVDQIRALTEFVNRTSHAGGMKLVILYPAHALNTSAANSLLKTLEEPTPDTLLLLVTDRGDSLPATLRSRCQRLLVRTPSLEESTAWLREQGVSTAQAETLAIAAGYRPLHAITLAAGNSLANADEFLRSLLAILQQRTPLQTVVAQAMKYGDGVAIEYLLRISSIVIRNMVAHEPVQDELLAALVRVFTGTGDRSLLARNLLRFNLEVERAMRQIRGSTNPNPQLLLESLLWQWSRLGQAPTTARV